MLGVSTDPSSSPEVSPIPTKTNTQSINDPIHHFLCLPESFSDLNTYITGLLTFLKTYKNLWKFHAVEFFIDDYWNSDAISSEWRETLGSDDVSIEDLFYFASENRVKDSWPESLKRYAQDIAQISLPRFPNDLMEMNPEYQEWMNKIRASAVPLNTALHTHGMSPKKIHEVELLASLIDLAAKETESRTIIDIGAGQGYVFLSLFNVQLLARSNFRSIHSDTSHPRFHTNTAIQLLASTIPKSKHAGLFDVPNSFTPRARIISNTFNQLAPTATTPRINALEEFTFCVKELKAK